MSSIQTFFRWPRRSLKISSCSWYSASVSLEEKYGCIKTSEQSSVLFDGDRMHRLRSTHSCGREGLRKGSESLPLTTLVLRCLGSEADATEREGDAGLGGFRLVSSFLCRSMSSLCWLIPSCCLHAGGQRVCSRRQTRKNSTKITQTLDFTVLKAVHSHLIRF